MIVAKKSLGQNFLIDHNILETIVNTIDIKNKTVLEIGPGTGNLTELLLKKNPKKMHLIEKDENLVNLLKNKFSKNLNIINEDILKFSKKNLLNNESIIFGNLPYNISSQILVKFIINKNKFKFKKLIFMFQKELADRIIAQVDTSNYGRLSILCNWKFDVEKLFEIGPNSFYPKPKIKSTLLIFRHKDKIFNFESIFSSSLK